VQEVLRISAKLCSRGQPLQPCGDTPQLFSGLIQSSLLCKVLRLISRILSWVIFVTMALSECEIWDVVDERRRHPMPQSPGGAPSEWDRNDYSNFRAPDMFFHGKMYTSPTYLDENQYSHPSLPFGKLQGDVAFDGGYLGVNASCPSPVTATISPVQYPMLPQGLASYPTPSGQTSAEYRLACTETGCTAIFENIL
jgi:hypothetical protein